MVFTSKMLQRAMRTTARGAARPTLATVARKQVGAFQHLSLLAHGAATRSHAATVVASVPFVGVGSAAFCSSAAPTSSPVAVGDRVSLHMSGKLASGQPFGETAGGEPLTFIVGSGEIIPGIEEGIVGLLKGESKLLEIAPEKAFGKDKQIHSIPRKQMNLPEEEDKKLEVGMVLQMQNGEQARIVQVTEDAVDIDLSHPFAGETLFVDITIVDAVARDQLSPEEQLVLPEEITPGDKATFPQRGDTLVMHYVGKLASDGTVFDSSRDRGQPFQFTIGVGQVIKGWDEGVLRMSKGQKAILNIPAVKGYGRAGAGGVIPPNADLVFEVELLDILSR